ncbi:MAG: nucleotidyltransferase [Saprospiraceae bacterium]|nr:nucleotidyltransferase [Saprospiraceae bacterium]
MKPTLLILAAGMGSRYGGLKQIDPLGPNGEALIEYSIYDAIRAGFGKVVFVIRQNIEDIFREKIGNQFSDQIEVRYAFQELDTPIEGINEFPVREKPWGTGHAVLVAKDHIQEPFAVINADDYYGIDSYQVMAKFLRDDCSPSTYAMLAYFLGNTLSDAGHVNRGVCAQDAKGFLTTVVERHKIQKTDKGITFQDEEEGGQLTDSDLVSMNFWGFHPNVFEYLRKDFIQFVKANEGQPRAEFYIPLLANRLIQDDIVKFSVLSTDAQWYGVTYQEDKPMVQKAFRELTETGKYPSSLWG